jgi:hypothetical protein
LRPDSYLRYFSATVFAVLMLVTLAPWYFILHNVLRITNTRLGFVVIAMTITRHFSGNFCHVSRNSVWLKTDTFFTFLVLRYSANFYVFFPPLTDLYFLIHLNYITFVLI